MSDPFFFGYGSLVNRATHAYPRAEVAHVTGWRRVWVGTGLRDLAFLSVEPAEGVSIAGLIAAVPGADWAALDLRERAYGRYPVAALCGAGMRDVSLYRVDALYEAAPGAHPILLSYLDTVVQGFLREFGAGGVAAFFDTTEGWQVPIVDDRAAPLYPRATTLSADERALVDSYLARVRAR